MSKAKNMLEVVRVRDDRGEYNATRAHAERIGARVLDGKPTRDERTGLPVPAKPVTDLAGNTPSDNQPKPTGEATKAAAGGSTPKES